MVFSSFTFLFIFFPVVVICYFLTKNTTYRNIVLLFASLIFYAWGEPSYLLLMLFSIGINWLLGIGVAKSFRLKKQLLVVACIVNLSILGFFKYSDFVLINLNNIGGMALTLLHVSLPLGISFYTFQALSYVIDVYRGKVAVQKNLLYFALYISMFPQLIAGPIVCYEDIQNQLVNRPTDYHRISNGIIRFITGLFKKVILANQAGKIWESLSVISGSDSSIVLSWLGVLFFAFQIYFDFSGYSDMAIGLGEVFGFRFPENFNYPYIAKSITDFWRRWHMTLSHWFLNYLYIPLGGNRHGKKKMIRNLFIVWFLTGLWHGAGWNFILWGVW